MFYSLPAVATMWVCFPTLQPYTTAEPCLSMNSVGSPALKGITPPTVAVYEAGSNTTADDSRPSITTSSRQSYAILRQPTTTLPQSYDLMFTLFFSTMFPYRCFSLVMTSISMTDALRSLFRLPWDTIPGSRVSSVLHSNVICSLPPG